MSNVDRTLQDRMDRMGRRLDNAGGPPDDPRMEERIKKLEAAVEKTSERLVTIERDLAVIKSNYATTATVSDAKNSIILWVVSAIFVAQLLPMVKDLIRPAGTPAAPTASETVGAPATPTK